MTQSTLRNLYHSIEAGAANYPPPVGTPSVVRFGALAGSRLSSHLVFVAENSNQEVIISILVIEGRNSLIQANSISEL